MTVTVLFSADFGHLQKPGRNPHNGYTGSQCAMVKIMGKAIFSYKKRFLI